MGDKLRGRNYALKPSMTKARYIGASDWWCGLLNGSMNKIMKLSHIAKRMIIMYILIDFSNVISNG